MKLTKRYRFSASHRLHSPQLPAPENAELYGKCNNPYGHGHNYVVDVQVEGPVDGRTGEVVSRAALDELVNQQVVRPYDHRNINVDVPGFIAVVPTTENVLVDIERRLRAAWPSHFPRLHRIVVFETGNNLFETSRP